MEQKVQRYFEMADDTFVMHSQIDGEFGPVYLRVTAEISPVPVGDSNLRDLTPFPSILSSISSPDPEFFNFRLQELGYFLQVFSMFNPLIKKDYGLSSSQEDS